MSSLTSHVEVTLKSPRPGDFNELSAGDGDDRVEIDGRNNSLSGDSGKDVLVASGSFSTLVGGPDADALEVFGNDNVVSGSQGNDRIRTFGDSNRVDGGDDADVAVALGSFNTLRGDSGDDVLKVTLRRPRVARRDRESATSIRESSS